MSAPLVLTFWEHSSEDSVSTSQGEGCLARCLAPPTADLLGTLGRWLEVHRDLNCTLQGTQGSQGNGGRTQLWLVSAKVTVHADMGVGSVYGLPVSTIVSVIVIVFLNDPC